MSSWCASCGSARLTVAYRVPSTARGLSVCVCERCGLIQSWPRGVPAPDGQVRVSGQADWGNIRYGKGFRSEAAMQRIVAASEGRGFGAILDVGANRGEFVLAAADRWPQARIVAVEPDARVLDAYWRRPEIELIVEPFEAVDAGVAGYDLIHCSHTLEHVDDPITALRKIGAALAPDGIAYLEVPNVGMAGSGEALEEWFIDKHQIHFDAASFAAMVAAAGMCPADAEGLVEDENLAVLVRRGAWQGLPEQSGDAARRSRGLVQRYAVQRAANLVFLAKAAKTLNDEARTRRIVVWGAGRLFDTLVRGGGLDPRALAGVVDRSLGAHVKEVHGLPITTPDRAAGLKPDVIVIASRGFVDEIRADAERACPQAELRTMWELMAAEQGRGA